MNQLVWWCKPDNCMLNKASRQTECCVYHKKHMELVKQPVEVKRKLATVQIISDVQPHPTFEKYCLLTVLGWQVVDSVLSNYKVGDKIVYFEIDSALPKDRAEFQFMSSYKFKVRTIRLKGELSQGLVMRLPEAEEHEPGTDLTEQLGVRHWDDLLEEEKTQARRQWMTSAKHKRGIKTNLAPAFPDHLVTRTDEERVQSSLHLINKFHGLPWYATLKIDGTSTTFLINPDTDEFMVCSRNCQVLQNSTPCKYHDNIPVYWMCAIKYDIERVMRKNKDLVVQGEIYGPHVQKNRLQVPELRIAVFNVWSMSEHRFFGLKELKEFCFSNALPMVPVVASGDSFEWTNSKESIQKLLAMARGTYPNTQVPREGLVFRTQDMKPFVIDNVCEKTQWLVRPSFKVINNEFLEHFHL